MLCSLRCLVDDINSHLCRLLSCLNQCINWDDLAQKKVPAPFVPKIRHELDLSNFSEEFTKMAATESPAIVPNMGEKLFKVGIKIKISGGCCQVEI